MKNLHEIVQNLPDGSSTTEAPEGAVLVKRGGRWVPEQAIAAATDAHNADAGAHGGLAFTGARHKVQLGRGAVVAFVGDSTWVQADTPMPQLLARKIGALEVGG